MFSKTSSTWSKHNAAWNLLGEYETCCSKIVWPMTVENVREFAIWALNTKNLKSSTVKTYLSSIKLAHSLGNLPCPDLLNDTIIKMILKGAENICKLSDIKITTRAPMSLNSLRILGHRLAQTNWKNSSKQLIWTACTVSFFSSCRMGELLSVAEFSFDPKTTLLWKHVNMFSDHIAVFVPYTKCKGLQGHVLEIFPFEMGSCCPYSALKNLYNEAIVKNYYDPEKPVFSFPSKRNLTTKKLNEVLDSLLKDLYNGECTKYSCHSFRAAIPSLISAHPDESYVADIMEWGGWNSSSFSLYTKLDHNRRKILYDKVSVLLINSLK